MARIKFRQFEQELRPVEQVYDVPAFQDVPAPENKISDVLLSENIARQKLGDTVMDLATTAGKIIAKESTRLRKRQWDESAPSAMRELNTKIEKQIIADYQAGLNPTQVEEGWFEFTHNTLMGLSKGPDVQSVHPEDRPKLMALLRAKMESGEVKALKQAYGMDNDLQTNTVLNSIRESLSDQLRNIQDSQFNKNEQGEGNGHNLGLEEFTTNYVTQWSDNRIEQILNERKIESPYIRDRIRMQAASDVLNFKTSALEHHNRIKNATAAQLWEQQYLEQVQTSALTDPGFRRRDGDERVDSRIAPAEKLIDEAVGSGYIRPEDAPRRKLAVRNLLDLNDVKTDIGDNPELALQRLSTEPITVADKIKFFKEHDIQLNDKGGLALSKRPENYEYVLAQWEDLEANTGGFYPTIQGGVRQDFITKAETALGIEKNKNRKLVFNQLDAGLRIIIDPNVDITEIQKVLDPEYIDQHRGARNIEKWELDQYKFLYQYGMEVRKGAGDFKMLSSQGMKDVESKLNPSNMDFGTSETEIFKRNVMDGIYKGFLGATAEVRKLRSQDQAAVGYQKALDRDIDPLSEDGLMVMLTDQLNWKGEIDFGASAEPQNFPSARELTRRVAKGELSIWTKSMAEEVETDWNAITETGSGIKKKKYLQNMLKQYGDYGSVALQQMFKMKGFTRADQMYMVIQDPSVLENLNTAQKNRDENKKNAAVIMDGDLDSYEELRTEIGRTNEFQQFFKTFYRNGQDKTALLDMYVDYALQLKSQNPSLDIKNLIDEDENHASVFRHLVKDLYEVIPGGSGDNVTVRIPAGELEGRDPDDAETGLVQFTKGLMQKRKNDQNWNFVGLEDESIFGDDLYQWKTNADESGMILTFYNTESGTHEPALYKGKTTTLSWEQLRGITDNRRRPVKQWINGTIKAFENYQFLSAERVQQAAEDMDLDATPIKDRPAKKAKYQKRREERLEKQKIEKQQEAEAEEKEQERLRDELGKQEEKKEEVIKKTLSMFDQARMTEYQRMKLPQDEIDKLMKMNNTEAELYLKDLLK